MANPTTNYGFVLPTPTDLVTDLPADFDVALQGVDTRLKALQPGTTLGDLVYASATANTNTRLGIGTTNQVLAVTAGVPAWTTISTGGMTLLSTTTLSGASTSISITPTGYNEIVIYVSDLANASACGVRLGINANTTATNYFNSWAGSDGPTLSYTGVDNSLAGVNAILPGQAGYAASNTNNLAVFRIPQPNSTIRKMITSQTVFFSNSNLNAAQTTVCNYIVSAALSSVQLIVSAGSVTAGTALVYGVK